ncbi:MAG: ribonuclease R [Victivallaceae bacterium]|nr:ribonuclease R [Victivallaceae bacterium]
MKKNKKKRLLRIVRRAQERRMKRENRFVEAVGTMHLSTHGYGFVTLDADDPAREKLNTSDAEIFIPAKFVDDALDNDRVKINFSPNPDESDPTRGPVGRVLDVLERNRTTMVGEVLSGYKVRPMSRKVPSDIQLSGGLRGAKKGDWVKIKLLPAGERSGERLNGTVLERIGQAGLIAADLDAVAAEYDLVPAYTDDQNMEAAQLTPRDIARRDLRNMHTVTIDPTDAKDFDDAVGVMPGANDNELILGVHISDVAGYIIPGGTFDREAAKRGFTAYLPGRTLPMLPKTLTAKISLQAGVDSLAHSVLFTVDKKSFKILKSERCHSIIRVDKRLNYEEVQDFFDSGKAPEDWTDAETATVKTELNIAAAWRKERRETEKFINLAMPEIRVLCDEVNNKIIGLVSKIQRESEELIEEFMLAANSAVAAELVAKHLPGLFRVHPQPDPEKLLDFAMTASDAFHIQVGDLSTRENCNKFLSSLPDTPMRPIILNAFLRSLPRAFYAAAPALHFGLGKTLYSHFTSPIRRYTDLLVHQQLWSMDLNQKWKSQDDLARLAERCSEQEENNDRAFFDANDRLKLRYLESLLGKRQGRSYTGVVRKVTAAGLLAEITELGIYGFIPISGGVERRRGGERIVHYAGHENYKPGDMVHLTLEDVDFSRNSAVFGIEQRKENK